jgi:hypothetical protein
MHGALMMRNKTRNAWTVLPCLLMALAIGFSSGTARSADRSAPLRETEILELLRGGVPSARIAALVEEKGISFVVTPETERRLRAAGATSQLLEALRRTSKPRPVAEVAPRVGTLNVETKPGEAEVYLNDEPKGITSREGKLRLSSLPTGAYRLRVSSMAYQSWENEIRVNAGETQTVFVTLVEKTAVRPAERSVETTIAPPPAEALSGFPIPNAKITGLRFFESGYDAMPKAQRRYTNRFEIQSTRYINWELDLVYPAVGSRIDFNIDAVWYRSDGSIFWRQSLPSHVLPDWKNSYHNFGRGCKTPPCNDNRKGWYKVELFIGPNRFASGSYELY